MRWTGQDKAAARGQQQSLHPEDFRLREFSCPRRVQGDKVQASFSFSR